MEMVRGDVDGMVQRVGYWWSDKKEKDISSEALRKQLRAYNLELVKLDLSQPLAKQGPFAVIVHKLLDMIVREIGGDKHAASICKQFDDLCSSNPRMRVLDPFPSVRALLDRSNQYQTVKTALDKLNNRISVPPFVRLNEPDPDGNVGRVDKMRLHYPLVCKPIVAQGSDAHMMYLIFNERGLRQLTSFPCVVQQFIPHRSVLYKVFVVGSTFRVFKRPSFKNVTNISTEDIVEFHSHDISKPGASSPLTDKETWLRPDERGDAVAVSERLALAVEAVRKATGQTLCGIDVIIEEGSGQLYVIDVNSFPSYSGMENFMHELTQLIVSSAREVAAVSAANTSRPTNGAVVKT